MQIVLGPKAKTNFEYEEGDQFDLPMEMALLGPTPTVVPPAVTPMV